MTHFIISKTGKVYVFVPEGGCTMKQTVDVSLLRAAGCLWCLHWYDADERVAILKNKSFTAHPP